MMRELPGMGVCEALLMPSKDVAMPWRFRRKTQRLRIVVPVCLHQINRVAPYSYTLRSTLAAAQHAYFSRASGRVSVPG